MLNVYLRSSLNILEIHIHFFFVYLFLAVLGLWCYARAFSSFSYWGLLFVLVP